ncbi:hypothetical protein [Xenorhabdus lircayensis]|uniref:Lipoprotein n=1 Tax=Xenorhabdus lircayensis TaxID=2763499 RepID=A0ABS0U3X2_9GAMM|nr:hypothetical protein [Xenorhabdus lircayensis]MBI6548584.1 hypothetical protein [Xenorhabdus lircayensis]
MKNVIFYLAFLFISGCALLNPPEVERTEVLDSKDNVALLAIATIFKEDKETYDSGEKSLIDWIKVKSKNDGITTEDIANSIKGDEDPSSKKYSLLLYSMYYLIKLSNPRGTCSSEECVLSLLESGASEMLKRGDKSFLEAYEADNKKFKFKYYEPEKIVSGMKELANALVKMKADREKQEIEENAKLPDPQLFKFKYTNDKYVNVALALINGAKLEKHNIRDRNGNKTKEYGKLTIYGRPFIVTLPTYPRSLLNQVKSCEKASAYTRVNIDDACKKAIIAGVKDWLDTAKDPNISEAAWRASARDAIIGVEIMFSHWAGMARVHQKSLSETGRISF